MVIKEGSVFIDIEPKEIVDKKMPVFYNPDMKLNRDISILLLNSVDNQMMDVAEILAGSGIRSIRFLKELNSDKFKRLFVNDMKVDFFSMLNTQFKLNKIKSSEQLKLKSLSQIDKYFKENNNKDFKKNPIQDKKVILTNLDANLMMMLSKGFDYIDVDPFGSPNVFLDMAVKRIRQKGILAVTATDTAPLSGTYKNSCKRKYWSVPLNNELMHEIGIRILIRKVQLIAGQYDKAMIPIFLIGINIILEFFLDVIKARKKVDEIFKNHGFFNDIGPIWLGKMWNNLLVTKMVNNNTISKNERLLSIIKDESKINSVGFYEYHEIAKREHIDVTHKKDYLIGKIQEKGYKASSTHFCDWAIRTDMPYEKFLSIFK